MFVTEKINIETMFNLCLPISLCCFYVQRLVLLSRIFHKGSMYLMVNIGHLNLISKLNMTPLWHNGVTVGFHFCSRVAADYSYKTEEIEDQF